MTISIKHGQSENYVFTELNYVKGQGREDTSTRPSSLSHLLRHSRCLQLMLIRITMDIKLIDCVTQYK